MKAFLFALLLIATLAHADGVPLFTPAETVSEDQLQRLEGHKSQSWVVGIALVRTNPAAIDSNHITLQIAGKKYSFFGKKRPTQTYPYYPVSNGPPVLIPSEPWIGSGEVKGNVLRFSRTQGMIAGSISVDGKRYELVDDFALLESNGLTGDAAPPEMLERWHREGRELAREATDTSRR